MLSLGGTGGSPYGASSQIGDNAIIAGGTGGSTQLSGVQIQDASVTVSGTGFAGVLVQNVGGAGGSGNSYLSSGQFAEGGNGGGGGKGGNSGGAAVYLQGAASIAASGNLSPGIVVRSIGGAGGVGATFQPNNSPHGDAGAGGAGGSAASIEVQIEDSSRISTNGIYAAGILVESIGGNGGDGGDRQTGDSGNAGAGGNAGNAGGANIFLSETASIVTSGDYSPGIAARSLGGQGGTAGTNNTTFAPTPQPGGNGGSSDSFYIVVDPQAAITTGGRYSPGIYVVTASGYGGGGSNDSGIVVNTGGNGGSGGQTGATVIQNGVTTAEAMLVRNFGRITTAGDSSFGIAGLAFSGGGGAGGNAGGFYGSGGSGSSTGIIGSIEIENYAAGVISTAGTGAHGILAASIAGGGGDGGNATAANLGVGGDPALAGNGGLVTINSLGTIQTTGGQSHGIVGISVGGGGGNGGNAVGFVAIGSTGGAGGSGGTVAGTLTSGSITTTGPQSHGIDLLSVGGGGGNGGNATSDSVFVGIAIGGGGGNGGTGGTVTFTGNGASAQSGGEIVTQGTKSAGLIAASIGGGGGTGGGASSLTVGPLFAVSVAVGGYCPGTNTSCGGGGEGGQATVNLSNTQIFTGQSPSLTAATITPTNLFPVDAHGVVAASIGGGGGLGGSAAANALAVAIPVSEEINIGISVGLSTGGAGGNGGGHVSGSNVSVSLNQGSFIQTLGNGSHGVLATSVGGGGGDGGDSSALAVTAGYNIAATKGGQTVYELAVTVAHGGSGGSGGDGGPVQVGLGGNAGTSGAATGSAAIVTYGDFADGIVAQSVGNGGGNAGFGATTSVNAGGARTLSVGVTVGSTGGSGGQGGTVDAHIFPAGSITTYGDGANGLVAHSIGGGGGTSQGGTITTTAARQSNSKPFDGPFGDEGTLQPTATLTINIGKQGAGGGAGGAVTVNMDGSISTQGGDSSGIIAQSIGGGGGLGGSSGSQGSADNPVSVFTKLRTVAANGGFQNLPVTVSQTLNLGNDGQGNAGNGGTVTVNQSGTITTLGDWSTGLHAMSIGGGGGRGGLATGTGNGPAQATIKAGLTGNGSGGTVSLTLSNAVISTGTNKGSGNTGYAAFGIVGQSVGGGGGFASEGSDAANGQVLGAGDIVVGSLQALAGDFLGNGSSVGTGGTVNLSGSAVIATTGDAAHAIVLQSIGGGGGITGAGSSAFTSALAGTGTIQLSVGGGSTTRGTGGMVNVTNGIFTISTSGANAFGLLAQSIGGGGGLGFTQPGVPTTAALGGNNPAGGNDGGSVNVSLAGGTLINTTGVGAHGVVLQSVGGGGGIAGYASGASGVPTLSTTPAVRFNTSGNGGAVTGDINAQITTHGAGAFAILAQSVGAGGGLLGDSSTGTLFAGSTGTNNLGSAGLVTITQSGFAEAYGENAVGIFAQSQTQGSGSGGSPHLISVTVNGQVSGGSGSQGTGIWIDGGLGGNSVTVNSSGKVSATSGSAITYSGTANLTVTNHGTIIGSVTTNGGAVNNFGTYDPGTTSEANVLNAGRLIVGGASVAGRTTIIGSLTQTAAGVMMIGADFAARNGGLVTVQGNATLGGRVSLVISSVLPNITLPFLTVTGSASGTLAGTPSSLFGYGVTRTGNTFSVAATSADFTPAGYALADSRVAVANHLQAAWERGGDDPQLGALFALLGNTADAGGASAYSAQLRQLSPDSTFAPGARGVAGAQNFANSTLSCPTFEGTTAMLVEGNCAWMRITGRHASQTNNNGLSNFSVNTTTWQIGGQKEIGSGWLLGGSLAFENSWVSSSDQLNTAKGQVGYGAVVVKYQTGPWLFAASAFGGAGEFNTSRIITLPGFGSVAKGGPDVSNLGLQLRAAYTIGQEAFYLRPSVSLSTIHVRTGAYRETGAGALNLSIDSASQTNVMLTPMLEVGGRIAMPDDMLLRPFLAAGLSVMSNDSWKQTGRLVSAPPSAGGFTTTVPMDQVVGRVTAGVQLYTARDLDFRLQYDGEYGGRLIGHGGSLVVSLRF